MDSEKIRKTLSEIYGGAASEWKRLRKFTNAEGITERHFQNAKLEMTLSVTDGPQGPDIKKLENAPVPAKYCYGIQMLHDGALDDEKAHCVFIMPIKQWKATQDNDWEPDAHEEREIAGLLPTTASHQGSGFWSWPEMRDPVESAAVLASAGKIKFLVDLQDCVDSELTSRIRKRLSQPFKSTSCNPSDQ